MRKLIARWLFPDMLELVRRLYVPAKPADLFIKLPDLPESVRELIDAPK